MEDNVTRDFLAAVLKDPSYDPRRLAPNWLASALAYRRPVYATEAQHQWPPSPVADSQPEEYPTAEASGWPPVAKQSQNAPKAQPDIGMGRAAMIGALQGGAAEFGDELAGGYAAGSTLGVNARRPVGMALQTILGLARMGYESLRGERGSATKTYERARDQSRADTKLAEEQYPITYYTGNIGAGLAVPAGKMVQAATLPARMLRGAAAAGLFGGLSGVGSGETVSDRTIRGVIGAGTGSILGAGMGAVAPVIAERAARMGRTLANRLAEGLDASAPTMRGGQNASHVRANRPQELWDPPTDLPQRPIELDYPRGVPVNAAGQITHTIEGQPIRARRIFGRTTKDGPEYSLQPGDNDFLARALMGKKAIPKSAEDMRNAWEDGGTPLGLTLRDKDTGQPREIWLQKGMNPLDWPRVYSHELAHAIDDFAGQLPTRELSHELRTIYNTLNNPNRTPDGLRALPGRAITPKDFDYPSDDIPREYAVEAMRAYMANPNYIKSVAPKTAQAIREFVNAHPRLSRIIQFNSLIGAPAAVGLSRPSDQAERGF